MSLRYKVMAIVIYFGCTVSWLGVQWNERQIAKDKITLKKSDIYARDRIVLLWNDAGSCTGVLVEGPKTHRTYVLTAAHCLEVVNTPEARATDEHGQSFKIRVLSEDGKSDLLLLSIDKPIVGLHIGEKVHMHEHVHTLTHGHAAPTYRTDGEWLGKHKMIMLISEVVTIEDAVKCREKERQRVIPLDYGLQACALDVFENQATAHIIPGSSGGALLNDNNELIGIASITDGDFGYFVRLADIIDFMAGL